jgi:two-component system sensor histidine kinase VicK
MAGAILVLQDITLQKRLEHDRNAFLALASHELRTPLSSVLGYADLLHQMASNLEFHQPDPAILQVAAGHISSEAEHMAFLIDEMLDLSSLDEDQLVLHLAGHDLAQILTQVVVTQTMTTEKHQVKVRLDDSVTDGKCMVQVDAVRLMQALRNLVNNAIKYSPQGGTIEVGLRLEQQPPSQALLWVSDQGLGIAQEDLPHLFDRFYRSQKPDRAISGLGIGLYLVKQIVTRHRGRIWVDSAEGHGSTFYVALPLTSS